MSKRNLVRFLCGVMAVLFLASLLPMESGPLLATIVIGTVMIRGLRLSDARAGPQQYGCDHTGAATGPLGRADQKYNTTFGGLGRLCRSAATDHQPMSATYDRASTAHYHTQKPRIFPAPPRASPVQRVRTLMMTCRQSLRARLWKLCHVARVALHAREPTLAGCH